MLLGKFAKKAGDSLWRELGEEVIKSAVNVLVEEGIEAAVEVVKKRALKIQEEELDHRDFGFEEEEESAGVGEAAADETADAAETEHAEGISPSDGADPSGEGVTNSQIESLSRYAERHSLTSGEHDG